MEKIGIKATVRRSLGKADAKQTRRSGHVPCIIYGGKENININVEERPLHGVIYTPHVRIIQLDVDGKVYDTVLKDAQFHPVSGAILHVDFQQVLDDRAVNISLPVTLKGTSPGVRAGGKLVQVMRKLKVRGLAKDMPASIIVDISSLNALDSVKIGAMNIPGVELTENPNQIIVHVQAKRGMVTEAAAAPAKK